MSDNTYNSTQMANDTAEVKSVQELESAIQDQHDTGELESRENMIWQEIDVAADDVDDEPADWNDVAEREGISAEQDPTPDPDVQAAASETADEPAAAEGEARAEDSAAVTLPPGFDNPVLDRLTQVLERLAPPKEPEPVAEPQEVPDYRVLYKDNDEFRERIVRSLQLDPTSAHDNSIGAIFIDNLQLKRENQAVIERLSAIEQRFVQAEQARTAATKQQTLDQTFAETFGKYEAVDSEIRDIFYGAAQAAMKAGTEPKAAVDLVFGKLGRLLKTKSTAPAKPEAPARTARTPQQARLERVVGEAGRGSIKATGKKNSTASLSTMEGSMGWGR